MKPKKPSPSREAIAAAPRIRNTKAELLDTITSQHKTILVQMEALARISDSQSLKVSRLKIILLLRGQLEKRLWDAVLELLAYEERETMRGYGYTRAEMQPVLNIRAMFE